MARKGRINIDFYLLFSQSVNITISLLETDNRYWRSSKLRSKGGCDALRHLIV